MSVFTELYRDKLFSSIKEYSKFAIEISDNALLVDQDDGPAVGIIIGDNTATFFSLMGRPVTTAEKKKLFPVLNSLCEEFAVAMFIDKENRIIVRVTTFLSCSKTETDADEDIDILLAALIYFIDTYKVIDKRISEMFF